MTKNKMSNFPKPNWLDGVALVAIIAVIFTFIHKRK
jgi:hypothetical protein